MVFWPGNIKNKPKIKRESNQEHPNTIINKLNPEKQESSILTEPQNNCNRNITHPNHTEQWLTQEEKMNIEILKRIMSEKKTTLPSLRNQDGKTARVETYKINELLTHISTYNITELNELIYAEAKLVWNRIGVSLKNTNRNSKLGWEIRLETQTKKNLRKE